MHRPVLIEAPTFTPVSLAEAKAALDIDYVEKDPLIEGLILAATSWLDGYSGILCRALCEQTWRQDYDCFARRLRLPLLPLISIDSVTYLDAAGAEQTVSDADYTTGADELGGYVQFLTTFAAPAVSVEPASVRVTYTAGYEAGGDVPLPPAIKQAMLLLIRQWFDNPSAVAVGVSVERMPFAVAALLAPFTRAGL